MTEAFYHIYVNGKCVHAALTKENMEKELNHINYFLELTNLADKAKIETVRCEPSAVSSVEGSY
jgi:hypothetical protein